MKLAAPATAAVVTVFLAGLAGPVAAGGEPSREPAPGAVALARHGTSDAAEPRSAASAIRDAYLTATRAGAGSPGTPTPAAPAPTAGGTRRPAGTAPVPPGTVISRETTISGLSCPAAWECVAVGSYTDSAGNFQGLLLTRHRRSWTAVRAPLPAGAAATPETTISGVACPSARECVAVGSYADSSGNFQGLLLTRHRRSWTAIRAPLPVGAATNPFGSISLVACASATACTAVGAYTDTSGNAHLLLLTRCGSSWTAATAPLPADAAAGIGGSIPVLACPSASACTAVGDYLDSSFRNRLLLLTGHGSSWAAGTAPLPAGASTNPYIFILGLACRSARACLATGYYGDANAPPAGNKGLLLTQRGSSWDAVTAPLPGGITGGLSSVWAAACPPRAGCVAVGGYLNVSGHNGGLLLTQHWRSWSAATAPLPAGAATNPDSTVKAVACPSAASCTAGGSYPDTSGDSQGLLLTRHWGSWTPTRAPLPAGAATNPEAAITAVACPSATVCTAIGSYSDSSGNFDGLLLTGHGPSWTATEAPLPAGTS